MKCLRHAGNRLIPALLLLLSSGSNAWAEYFVLDQSKADRSPDRFGYTVDVTDEGGSLRIVLKMGKEGTKAFQSAQIHGKFKPLVVETNSGITTVNVSVRKEDRATCVLRLRSKPLHSTPKPGADFKGYDLVLHTLKFNKKASSAPKRPATAKKTLKKTPTKRYGGRRGARSRSSTKRVRNRSSSSGNPVLGPRASDASLDGALRGALEEFR